MLQGRQQAADHGCLVAFVDGYPSGCEEGFLHLVLGAEDGEVDHIAGIADLVADAPRDVVEDGGRDEPGEVRGSC